MVIDEVVKKGQSGYWWRTRPHKYTVVAQTGKAHCDDDGLINPIRFNLSADTLQKIKR